MEQNHHGHYTIQIIGRSLTGKQESQLLGQKFRLEPSAVHLLHNPDYDAKHRLKEGKRYLIALVPFQKTADFNTVESIQEYGCHFGYRVPRAGIMPRILETVSDEQMVRIGIRYMASLHDPIQDTDGTFNVLQVQRYYGGSRCLDAYWTHPDFGLHENGAFPFLMPIN